jgi:hypothetical protein
MEDSSVTANYAAIQKETLMTESNLISRHRNKDGEISRKHGNTLICTLRKTYGLTFAKNCSDTEKLSDVLHKLDERSLSKLIADHEWDRLEQICKD